jgi:nucleoside-diphosphate-sugar epimerase
VFLAGATGVLGLRVVPLLVDTGHDVVGMTRTAGKAEQLTALGAHPIVCDVFERDALVTAVVDAAPDLVLHELTDLPDDAERIPELGDRNARMRRDGTDNLLAAMRAAGTRQLVAQSVAWDLGGAGAAAVAHLEGAVLAVDGVVLRYGRFHGPGTYYPDTLPDPPRVSLDTAAERTVAALGLESGTYVVAD